MEKRDAPPSTPPRQKDALAAGSLPPTLLARLGQAGLRRTLATRAVLGLFMSRKEHGLTHTQVFAELKARGLSVDRVTLYRLLDRLAQHQVLRRQVDDARSFRYWMVEIDDDASQPGGGAQSGKGSLAGLTEGPLFECLACHQQTALPEKPSLWQDWWAANAEALAAKGHSVDRLQMRVVGTCATCVAAPQ